MFCFITLFLSLSLTHTLSYSPFSLLLLNFIVLFCIRNSFKSFFISFTVLYMIFECFMSQNIKKDHFHGVPIYTPLWIRISFGPILLIVFKTNLHLVFIIKILCSLYFSYTKTIFFCIRLLITRRLCDQKKYKAKNKNKKPFT